MNCGSPLHVKKHGISFKSSYSQEIYCLAFLGDIIGERSGIRISGVDQGISSFVVVGSESCFLADEGIEVESIDFAISISLYFDEIVDS